MQHVNPITRRLAVVSTVIILTVAAGCSKPTDPKVINAEPSQLTPGIEKSGDKVASKLGDLSTFNAIALDVAAIVDKGDLPAAKVRIKDLEIAWDSAEAGLKPRAADDWHVLDRAIDKALESLRADAPAQAECRAAIVALLKVFATLSGKA